MKARWTVTVFWSGFWISVISVCSSACPANLELLRIASLVIKFRSQTSRMKSLFDHLLWLFFSSLGRLWKYLLELTQHHVRGAGTGAGRVKYEGSSGKKHFCMGHLSTLLSDVFGSRSPSLAPLLSQMLSSRKG